MSIAYLYSASSDSTNDERVMTGQDRSQLDHIILEVIERGYHRGYELFRPAKVVVNDLSTPDLTDEPETLRL
jgi:hypothetical protein